MDWIVSVSGILRDKFHENPFSVKDAASILEKEKGYSRNVVYQALHELVNEGTLIRVGRGVYSFPGKQAIDGAVNISASVAVRVTSEVLKKAEEVLRGKGIEFMVTGPSTLTSFQHLLPRRLIHLIYVVKGAGEFAAKSLGDAELLAVLNPRRKETETTLELFKEKDIFIIREFLKLDGNVEDTACLERSLVDTYFEATRHRIPYSEAEAGRVIRNVFRNEKVNVTCLLKLAGRRGIKDEFKAIVKELMPDYPVEGRIQSRNTGFWEGLKE